MCVCVYTYVCITVLVPLHDRVFPLLFSGLVFSLAQSSACDWSKDLLSKLQHLELR